MQEELITEGEFRYIKQGEGPVLLILHGLFGALSNFKEVLDRFRNDYTVVIPMMPIYELPVQETHVRSLAAFIHRFVEFKGLKEINLLGNSLGGHVALVYALTYPEMVNTMILTGSSGLYENAMGGSFPRREDYDFIQKKVAFTFSIPKQLPKNWWTKYLRLSITKRN